MNYLESIKTSLDTILEFVYPSTCLTCDTYLSKPGGLICPACWDKIDIYDYHFCANCMGIITEKLECLRCSPEETLPLIAYGHFSDPLGEMIRQFKYRGFRRLAPEMADRVIEKNAALLSKLNLDVIIPIPLHSYRLKSRGFNQAEILADIFGKRLNIPVDKEYLRKIRNTRDQKMLDHDAREDNIRGSFRIFEDSGAGGNILLVDDVVTTGATMREARKVIRQAGGNVILAAVIATAGLTM